jgi:hypothetical protein
MVIISIFGSNCSQRYIAYLIVFVFICLSLSSCASPGLTAGAVVGGIVGLTSFGAYSIGAEIQQVYYFAVVDLERHSLSGVYRLTVHGQASMLNKTKFATGWVPSAIVDALHCDIKAASASSPSNAVEPACAGPKLAAAIKNMSGSIEERLSVGPPTGLRLPFNFIGAIGCEFVHIASSSNHDRMTGFRCPPDSETKLRTLWGQNFNAESFVISGQGPSMVRLDSLNCQIRFQKGYLQESGQLTSTCTDPPILNILCDCDAPIGHMLVLGPEGPRTISNEQRLVIVMASNPDSYFKAVKEILGYLDGVQANRADSESKREELRKHVELGQLQQLKEEINRALPSELTIQ